MADGDIEAIKARIRALLAKTPARGCTEAEAIAATAKALEMMQRHGLSEDAVAVTKARVKLRTLRWTEIDAIWPTVAVTARCVIYLETGRTQRNLVFLGCDPWPEIGLYLHSVIDGAAARAARDFAKSAEMKRRRSAKTKTLARRNFMAGFAVALVDKLRGLVDSSDPAHRRDLARATKALEAEGPMRATKARRIAPGAGFGGAFDAGIRSGREAHVGLGMRGAAAPLALAGRRDHA